MERAGYSNRWMGDGASHDLPLQTREAGKVLVLVKGAGLGEGWQKKQGTHCTGKMVKESSLSGKTQNLEILPKRGIWFAQVVNSLILMVKAISIFAAKIPPKKC